MTNNPTIDGVSRELLANLHKIASRKCKSAWSAGICDELRALLDAPAVERQEAAKWSYCPECGSEEIHHEEGAHKQCAECHQEWFSDLDYTDVVRKHLSGAFTDKDSTIARLEARVAELESGRGEPAPPTGGDVEVLIDQLDDYIARINGDDSGSNATVNELRCHVTRLQAEVELWKVRTTNICRARAELQSELTRAQSLVDQALHLQNEHYYGDGTGLHLAMIKWARCANQSASADKGGDDEQVACLDATTALKGAAK